MFKELTQQEIMAKYALLVGEALYGIDDFKVEFKNLADGDEYDYDEPDEWLGECQYLKEKKIYFSSYFYSNKYFDSSAWNTIVHEITHLKVLGHRLDFWTELAENMRKCKFLQEEFNFEVGWDKGFSEKVKIYYDPILVKDLWQDFEDEEDFDEYGIF